MFRFAIVLFTLMLLPARANLGETVAQCVARYGRPVGYSEANGHSPFGTVAFSAGGYTLIVFLLGQEEVGARVSKKDNSAFSDAELKNIMGADVGGSQWTPGTSPDPSSLTWSRGDKATVLYDKDKHVLIFTSPEMATAIHAPAPAPVSPAPPAAVTAPAAAPVSSVAPPPAR